MAAKHKKAGQYLKNLRIEAGFPSRDAFVKKCGSLASYDRISKLENGFVEPKAKDLQLYYSVAECHPLALLRIPV